MMKNNLKFPKVHFLLLAVGLFFATVAPSVLAQNEPTIAKDSVKVFTADISGSRDAPKDKQLQWKPGISFRVNGPISGGSQLWVEFGYPGRKEWAKFDCQTREIA